ncbi:methylenetetrahydrofolate reductase [Bradyrhizobium sp. Ash2021]|uniref:methylenetetrahydrofolate reductase n=1 Tax=Bradyrhizobium sp. Ash2021 TaxID=2954771 RepID=UPI0028157F9D|nr:methylenetetrahydrofolate reductase [Bradyrhizobium sp. Ash2021]WMT72065.1 methylenetetrahydrofolate reductase [Bradyrhizobium sp. Ash2021]
MAAATKTPAAETNRVLVDDGLAGRASGIEGPDMLPESCAQRNSTINVASSLMRGFSLEATLPNQTELEALRDMLPSTTEIFVAAPPGRPHSRVAETAKRVRKAGFEPVPHIAARNYESAESLGDFVERICGEAGVRRVLVIAGDVDRPAGPYLGANAVIETDLLQCHGIREVGVSGYPDGHPKLSDQIVARALRTKLKSAEERNLKIQIVSQLCFDADKIAAWMKWLRMSGINVPVSIGLAGPTSLRGLARFALMCGVRNSFKAFVSGKTGQLVGEASPDDIIHNLSEALDLSMLGQISIHLYSYGGLVRTANWAKDFQARFVDG